MESSHQSHILFDIVIFLTKNILSPPSPPPTTGIKNFSDPPVFQNCEMKVVTPRIKGADTVIETKIPSKTVFIKQSKFDTDKQYLETKIGLNRVE